MATERELLDSIQAAKAAMIEDLKELLVIQRKAGRLEAMNEVFLAISALNTWHGLQTRQLFKHFPEHVNEVVAMGPPR